MDILAPGREQSSITVLKANQEARLSLAGIGPYAFIHNPKTTVIKIETDRESMVGSCEAWWDVPAVEVSGMDSVSRLDSGMKSI